jgi:hypothetical protein
MQPMLSQRPEARLAAISQPMSPNLKIVREGSAGRTGVLVEVSLDHDANVVLNLSIPTFGRIWRGRVV